MQVRTHNRGFRSQQAAILAAVLCGGHSRHQLTAKSERDEDFDEISRRTISTVLPVRRFGHISRMTDTIHEGRHGPRQNRGVSMCDCMRLGRIFPYCRICIVSAKSVTHYACVSTSPAHHLSPLSTKHPPTHPSPRPSNSSRQPRRYDGSRTNVARVGLCKRNGAVSEHGITLCV